MTLRERQNLFIADLAEFDNWSDRFNYLISLSEKLPAICPDSLRSCRIENCQSSTYLKVYVNDGLFHLSGWSNSAIVGGLIVAIIEIFNLAHVEELLCTDIDFHIKSGLIDNLTTMRRSALEEMIRRIAVLYI